MSGTDKNPPAFPVFPEPGVCSGTNGMTLRDYFAAQAMQAILSVVVADSLSSDESWDPSQVAVDAYVAADHMLAERMEPEEP